MLADRDADDDAYLAELRKAMTDESPLGPREDDDDAVVRRRGEPPQVAVRPPSLTAASGRDPHSRPVRPDA